MTRAPRSENDLGLDLDETTLTLRRPLDELDPTTRNAVVGWLTTHGVTPELVAIDAPVERREASSSLVWRQDGDEGLVRHHRFPAVDLGERWPAPFPEEIRVRMLQHLSRCA